MSDYGQQGAIGPANPKFRPRQRSGVTPDSAAVALRGYRVDEVIQMIEEVG